MIFQAKTQAKKFLLNLAPVAAGPSLREVRGRAVRGVGRAEDQELGEDVPPDHALLQHRQTLRIFLPNKEPGSKDYGVCKEIRGTRGCF